jgi:hypothetical protein
MRRINRRAEGPKFIDFSAGMPAVIHGGPPRLRAACPAGGSRFGVAVSLTRCPRRIVKRSLLSDSVG